MKNVELKAELRDLALAREICKSQGAQPMGVLEQTDTYYRMASGRLKRRDTTGKEPEYIFYERPNQAASKVSQFTLYSQAQATERFGRQPLEVWLTVTKQRELWMLENTRIHLDQVQSLGSFLEFEYLVSSSNTVEAGRLEVQRLRQAFAIVLGEIIDCSYSDLLEAHQAGRSH